MYLLRIIGVATWRAHVFCCVPKYTRVGCAAVARAPPACTRAGRTCFAWHNFVIPDLACAIWYRDLDIIWFALWKHVFGVFTTCTTRCGFVNVAFGFAARKASRHQLHKHVNAHVYLGVLAYYAKQRPSRCWGSTWSCRWTVCVVQLSYSQIWEVQIGSCESRISCYSGSGSTYSRLHLFRVRWKVAFGWVTTASVTWFDMCMHVFCAFRVNGV